MAERPAFADLMLVLVGGPLTKDETEVVEREGLTDRIVQCAHIEDTVLEALYCVAEALLFPSLHEGFGWPVLEAQACGCLVVTSDRPPLPWVAGDGAAILVPPDDPAGAAAVIEAAWPERAHLIARGQVNLARFDFASAVALYMQLYRRV